MRNIKFRAWDGLRMTTSGISFNNTTGEVTGKVYGVEGNEVEMPIMQFTGLCDSDGQEIYEGDFIQFGDEKGGLDKYIMKVIWYNESWKLDLLPHRTMSEAIRSRCIAGRTSTFKVIGNIYENPGLLED